MTDTTINITTPATTTAPARTTLRGTAWGTAFALVATTAVFIVGNLGAPIRVITGWSPDGADLTYGEVAGTVVVAVGLGGAVLWALERWRAGGFRIWQAVAAAVAVVSALPLLRLEIDAGSKVALVSMHLLTGACAIAAHRIMRRTAR